jgi:hypothetical protein
VAAVPGDVSPTPWKKKRMQDTIFLKFHNERSKVKAGRNSLNEFEWGDGGIHTKLKSPERREHFDKL